MRCVRWRQNAIINDKNKMWVAHTFFLFVVVTDAPCICRTGILLYFFAVATTFDISLILHVLFLCLALVHSHAFFFFFFFFLGFLFLDCRLI